MCGHSIQPGFPRKFVSSADVILNHFTNGNKTIEYKIKLGNFIIYLMYFSHIKSIQFRFKTISRSQYHSAVDSAVMWCDCLTVHSSIVAIVCGSLPKLIHRNRLVYIYCALVILKWTILTWQTTSITLFQWGTIAFILINVTEI